MAAVPEQQTMPDQRARPVQERMSSISMDGVVTIVGAVLLLLAIIYFNNDLQYRLDTKIDTVRTELKADIADLRTELKAEMEAVRTELKTDIADLRAELKADIADLRMEVKADIDNARMELSADIQHLDDRIFAIVNPAAQPEEAESQ